MPKNHQESVDSENAQHVLNSKATKSDKIRQLNQLGVSRADIARALEVRYQFVRNVLEHDRRSAASDTRLSPADRLRVDELTANLETKAARIRALDAAGFRKPQIADALGLRYQHVYNVLAPAAGRIGRVAEGRPVVSAAAYSSLTRADPLDPVRVVVEAGRRVMIPQAFVEAVGIAEGDDVVLSREGDELRLCSQETAIRRVQHLVAQYVPAGVSLVDELLAERRREAAREADDA